VDSFTKEPILVPISRFSSPEDTFRMALSKENTRKKFWAGQNPLRSIVAKQPLLVIASVAKQ
jgi:hypothetical protein